MLLLFWWEIWTALLIVVYYYYFLLQQYCASNVANTYQSFIYLSFFVEIQSLPCYMSSLSSFSFCLNNLHWLRKDDLHNLSYLSIKFCNTTFNLFTTFSGKPRLSWHHLSFINVNVVPKATENSNWGQGWFTLKSDSHV